MKDDKVALSLVKITLVTPESDIVTINSGNMGDTVTDIGCYQR